MASGDGEYLYGDIGADGWAAYHRGGALRSGGGSVLTIQHGRDGVAAAGHTDGDCEYQCVECAQHAESVHGRGADPHLSGPVVCGSRTERGYELAAIECERHRGLGECGLYGGL